jgi:hypothetical protein
MISKRTGKRIGALQALDRFYGFLPWFPKRFSRTVYVLWAAQFPAGQNSPPTFSRICSSLKQCDRWRILQIQGTIDALVKLAAEDFLD